MSSEDMQLADYTGVLRRRWWIILAAALIGTAAGVGYLMTANKVYTATASVYVTATSGTVNQVSGGRTTGTVNLDTQAQVVQSATVAQAAAKLIHSTDTVPQLINRVSVTVPANSQVLAISCQASSAVKAATCAQSFAQAYLTYSTASTTAAAKSQIAALQSRIGSLESASAKLTVEVASLPDNSSQRAAAEEQLRSDHSQLGSLNSQVAQLAAALANPSGGSILSSAVPPQKASSPKPLLILPSGLLAGLLIGLVLAFLADRQDRRIRGPRDVTKLDVPVLMSLPLKSFTPEMAIAVPRSPTGRDFTELAHVLTGSLGAGNHVVLVTGASAGYGTGLVAANLAVALSRNQPDVTLVCANLEGSPIPDMVGLPPGPGLTDMLAGDMLAGDMLADGTPAGATGPRLAAAPRLRLIRPGSAAGAEAEDLPLDAVERLVAELSDTAQWIILEAPAAMSGPDVYTLAHVADAAVLVAEVPRTCTNHVRDSVQHLEKMGVPVLGAVLLPSPKALPRRVAAAPALERTGPLALGSAVPGPAAEPGDEDAGRAETEVGDWSTAEEASSSLRGS
jgi:capsular polysaccharide biosynthesis protein/MinD-like ATPase involved in chromosome partitioning or flagellar assembly